MLKAKLLHNKTYINQKCKGGKEGGIYQNLWPINTFVNFGNSFNSIILSPLSPQEKISWKNAVREEWPIPVCLEDNDKNLGESFAWGHD